MAEENYLDSAVVLAEIIAAFRKVNPQEQERLLQTVATFFGIRLGPESSSVRQGPQVLATSSPSASGSAFSEDRSVSPKEFLMQKQPQTDVQRVACLAYYLTHYRSTPHFKTLDISSLNTEAAQVKFSNAAFTVANATNAGYLVTSTKGNKQLSGPGERFVQLLPDHEAARAAMAKLLPKRKGRKPDAGRTDGD